MSSHKWLNSATLNQMSAKKKKTENKRKKTAQIVKYTEFFYFTMS